LCLKANTHTRAAVRSRVTARPLGLGVLLYSVNWVYCPLKAKILQYRKKHKHICNFLFFYVKLNW
jgi:hypothetical protein